jgi:hypothetical protein
MLPRFWVKRFALAYLSVLLSHDSAFPISEARLNEQPCLLMSSLLAHRSFGSTRYYNNCLIPI